MLDSMKRNRSRRRREQSRDCNFCTLIEKKRDVLREREREKIENRPRNGVHVTSYWTAHNYKQYVNLSQSSLYRNDVTVPSDQEISPPRAHVSTC
ncbi:hypothetical protein EVAR_101705_1 [Eumeta japonica]|uniref:Uncharacterized protein n=1 Tax=Eumeta variegata TaxID=151549 RepID=A0A4C1T2K7_EUMVA|nr:hypothetical protein EVAR_101705_1 [Eumeta japonica]